VEIADEWNWLGIVFIVGLGTEDFEFFISATRVCLLRRDICCGDSKLIKLVQNRVHFRPGL